MDDTYVWILTDAMDRFQGVFGSFRAVHDTLTGKYGEGINFVEESAEIVKAYCPEDQMYTIQACIPITNS